MESVGEAVFYLALVVWTGAAAVYFILLIRMVVVAIRRGGADRPMVVNYAALVFGLSIPVMVVGLVIWGRLPWWVLLLFAPFLAMRYLVFNLGRSVSAASIERRRIQADSGHVTEAADADYVLHFEITPDALVDALQLHRAPMYRTLNSAVVFILLSAVVMVVTAVPMETVRGLLLLAALMTASSGAAIGLMRSRRLLRWSVARRGEGAFGPVELTSDTGGLRIATPASTTTVAWPQLTALRLDDRTLLFERHRLLVVWVPRTAFASDRERDEFVRYAQYQMTRPSA